MVETNTGKILSAALVVTGIYLLVKNHKRDGIWVGLGAGFLIFGAYIKTYKD